MNSSASEESTLDAEGLSSEEVGALWAFLHGDIMEPGIRRRLRDHWGLCPRHAWGHAVVEIELWETGAGARGGHQPFDVGVLYDDLLLQMTAALTARRRRPTRVLRRAGACYLCQQLGGASATAIGYAGFTSGPLSVEANTMTYTRRWLDETEPLWASVVCPDCAGTDTGGRRCRSHLLATGMDPAQAADLARYLGDVDQRLARLVGSMTEGGARSTPDSDASWVEAVSWFTGWSFPLTLVHNR